VTNQPDYGTLVIEYVPDKCLAETKSIKLYLWKYRDQHGFNEVLVDTIASDLFQQIRPLWLRVTGKFNPRGGISVTATAEHGDEEYRPS
jgi:7-cyano-7-deazaguanine reductase